jgi:hypothetical protein
VKGILLVAGVLLAAGTTASAQDPAAPTPKPQAPPATAPHASPAPNAADLHDVRTMEAVLTSAVRMGAENLSRQMQAREPGSMFLIDTGRARGFVLEGYGVFFVVDVPMMRQSAVWSARQLMLQDVRDKIQTLRQIAASARDAETRRQAQMQERLLTMQLQAASGTGPAPQQDTVTVPAVSPQGSAQAVANAAPQPPGTVGAAVAPDAPVAPAPVASLADPSELYTEAVKTALIDAMLKHSFSLRLADEEWLTVAARDAEGPTIPGQIDNATTIVIRIKGSDLTAFVTNKLTREEVLKKVQVREF